MANLIETENRLVDFVADYRHDPLGYAQASFEWGKGELTGSSGPRAWQRDILDIIGKRLRDPATRHQPIQIAVASGHDIGKSALISMILQWGESTSVDTKGVVTANTDTQLRTKTWPEVTKWFRLALNSHWFKPTATAVAAVDPSRERTWRADAIPWSETTTESFAGLHNLGRRIILIFDEASAISDKIWEVAEGALIDEDTEIIWLVFGNPTRNVGRFRECFGKFRHRWTTRQIDSRTVEGTNKNQISKLVEDYGEDSDFVRVRVRGEFPRAGTMQFVPGDIVDAARKRDAYATLSDPLIMGVDVARFGDDQSVIVIRRGRDARTVPWLKFRGLDTMTLAAKIMELQSLHQCDAIFVDGGGVGGGVIDRLRMLQQNVIEVSFGGTADRAIATTEGAVVYYNKRAEMWGYMRDWLAGGSIPDDPELASDLVGVEYGYKPFKGIDSIILEKKADMKKRGLASPDNADALALTFAYPVQPSDHTQSFLSGNQPRHTVEYDPFSKDRVNPGASKNKVEYDPLRRGA